LAAGCATFKTNEENLLKYTGNADIVIIPEELGITRIESGAFSGKKLSSITIPGSVTYIGPYAFRRNNLTSVTIPDSVKEIKIGAFSDNPLTSITISRSVDLTAESFGVEFYGAYSYFKKQAGTYILQNDKWTLNGEEPVFFVITPGHGVSISYINRKSIEKESYRSVQVLMPGFYEIEGLYDPKYADLGNRRLADMALIPLKLSYNFKEGFYTIDGDLENKEIKVSLHEGKVPLMPLKYR
jgi:hypothetical protein